MQDRYNLFKDKDIRAYDRKLEKFALQQQKQAQDDIYKKYNQKRQEIKSRLGQAYGDPEAIKAIQDEYDAAKKQLKADLATTQDVSQYKKLNENAFGPDGKLQKTAYQRKEDFDNFSKEYDKPKPEPEDEKTPPEDGNSGKLHIDKVQNAISDAAGAVSTGLGAVSTGLGAYLNSKIAGGRDPNSGHARNQAKIHEEQAAQYQKDAQANKQIANRDYRGEAEKNAIANAATENAQKIANMGNVSAGAAALARTVGTADYNTHMQRQDTQRAEGVKNMQNMHDNRSAAEEQRAAADQMDYNWQQQNNANAWNQYLSSGGHRSSSDTAVSKSQDADTAPTEQQPSTQPEATKPAEQPAEQPAQNNKVGLQNLTNYGAGSPVRRAMDSNGNVRGYRVSNGNISRAEQYDHNVSGEYSGPEYTADNEAMLQQALKDNPQYARQQGESVDAWTHRINGELGRGGNLGDFGSGFYNNFANEVPYKADQQNITSAVNRAY